MTTHHVRGKAVRGARPAPVVLVSCMAVLATAAAAPARPAAPDTIPPYVGALLSPYRGHPDVEHVRNALDRWSRDWGPTTFADSLAAAAAWRRAGQYRTAVRALPAARSPEGELRPTVELERARILLQAPPSGPRVPGTEEERRAEGAAAFWSACGQANAETRTAVWEDLRGLATPGEQADWSSLGRDSADAVCVWVRRFVEERALRMAVSPAERLHIHYRRLHEARRRYYIRTPRLTRDLSDRLGRPAGLEIDDRGLILLRMGEPLARVAPFMDLNETWAYYRPEGARVFHFAPVSKTGLRALGDYRLLENLAHSSGLTMPSELLGAGGARLAYLYQSRRVLDFLYDEPRFRRMDTRMRAAGGRFDPGFLGFLAYERAINKEDASYAVSGIPDAPDLSPAIEFAYEALRFREPGTDRMEVWFLASTRAADLTATRESRGEGGAVSYRVGARLSLLTPDGLRSFDAESRPVLDDPLRGADGIPVRLRAVLEPARHPFTLALRDLGSARSDLGNWVSDSVAVYARQADLPAVSDIAVAADSGGTWTRDGRTFLPVDPTHVVGSDGAAHIYFEVYGVRPGEGYDVEVRVVPRSLADRVFEASRDEAAFTLEFPSVAGPETGAFGIGRHHLEVRLGDSPPGAYLLALRVRSARSGVLSLPAVTPLYRPDDPDAHWVAAPRRRSTIVDP